LRALTAEQKAAIPQNVVSGLSTAQKQALEE
jgi:hypothetical protein